MPESRKQQRAAFIALEEEMHSGGSGGWGAIDFSFNDSDFFFFLSILRVGPSSGV